ncbi:MAG: hypothetical protein L6R41_001359 [Letrouitia leprolyta]|nr:MAG: hypothetical protein L6R41_001359 [Letrouitia leprolyta]
MSVPTSTTVRKAFTKLREVRKTMSSKRVLELLSSAPSNGAGSRFWPAADPHRDREIPIRFDRGEIHDGKQRIYVQRNADTKDPSWTNIDTHANSAWFEIDMNKKPEEGDLDEMLDVTEARTKLGENTPPEVGLGSEGSGSGSESVGSVGNGKGKGKGKEKEKGKGKGKGKC